MNLSVLLAPLRTGHPILQSHVKWEWFNRRFRSLKPEADDEFFHLLPDGHSSSLLGLLGAFLLVLFLEYLSFGIHLPSR